MASRKEVPVYLFTGFLDSGKTTFIQETLEDPGFDGGEKTLVILCEEGEVELEPSRFVCKDVEIVTVEDEDDLNPQFLSELEAKYAKVSPATDKHKIKIANTHNIIVLLFFIIITIINIIYFS